MTEVELEPHESVQRYSLKPETIQAVQLTMNNAEVVANWCGGEVKTNVNQSDRDDIYLAVVVPTLAGNQNLDVKKWLVKDLGNGRFRILPDAVFHQEYESPVNHVRIEDL